MSNSLRVGLSHTLSIIVNTENTAIAHKSGTLPVLATPAMISFIENAAMCAVLSCLSNDETTVGTRVDIRHLKATPVGVKVVCKATLTQIEEKKLVFEVLATDETGKIGIGTHVRYIVDKINFMKNLPAK